MSVLTYDVFISHSSRNADLGSLMKQYLATRGIRCWKAPDDIEPSEPWPAAIMRGLRECPIVVLIWTKESMASDQVLKEITIADQKTKAIIPFRAEEIMPEGGLEYFLVAKQWLDAHPSFELSLETLADTVLRILGRTADASPIDAPTSEAAMPADPKPQAAVAVDPLGFETQAPNVGADPISMAATAEVKPDHRKFLGKLEAFEAFASDSELREKLGWSDKKFDKVKDALVENGTIISGSGRGGATALSTPKLRQLKEELMNDSLPGGIFVNIGEAKEEGNTPRDWALCATHGFVSAGHGSRYANDMKRIRPGAIVYAYSSGAGYVGVGTALEAAVPMAEFHVDGIPLQEKVSTNSLLFHHLDDLELCEWVVRVKWDKTFDREQAIYRTGLFVYVATSCRMKDAITVKYLRSRFNSFLELPTLTEADMAG
jgi:hypothetical protein